MTNLDDPAQAKLARERLRLARQLLRFHGSLLAFVVLALWVAPPFGVSLVVLALALAHYALAYRLRGEER